MNQQATIFALNLWKSNTLYPDDNESMLKCPCHVHASQI